MTDSVTNMTNDELFDLLAVSMDSGCLGAALAAADELCRPERASKCHDLMAPAYSWHAMLSYTEEQRQGLEDRIAQYNAYVATGG